MPLKISVIVPCYNLGEFLLPCLNSIDSQHDDEVEFIFVDDGSTDETPLLLERFCKEHNNCITLHQSNSGVSAARNAALKQCRGEYVYLLDGDDILTRDAIGMMKRTIEKYGSDVVLSPVAVKSAERIVKKLLSLPVGIYTPEEVYKDCRVFPTMPQLLYKRAVIEYFNLIFDTSLVVGEVYDFTIRYLAKARSVAVVQDCYFYYVMRHSSASHRPDYFRDLTVVDTIRKYYINGFNFLDYPSFNTTAFKMMMSFTYNKYFKLHLRGKEVYAALKILFLNNDVRKCIRNVAKSNKTPWKERLLAIYVMTTGVKGYKLLTKFL